MIDTFAVIYFRPAVVGQEDLTLQQMCMQMVSKSVTSSEHIKKLPLPEKFQDAIIESREKVYVPYVPERYKKVWAYIHENEKYIHNDVARFTDFFRFCMFDKRRKEHPYLLERMRRIAEEERVRGRDRPRGPGDRESRRWRERYGFYDDFLMEDFPFSDQDFW